MAGFDTGVSALDTSQRALDIIGQNLANSSTPGYHRQVLNLATAPPTPIGNLSIGSGVQIVDVQRLRDSLVENATTVQTYQAGDTNAQLDSLNQVQAVLGQDGNTLGSNLTQFFNQLTQLAATPQDTTLRQVVLGSAQTLTQGFNSLGNSLDQLSSGLDQQLGDAVNQITATAQQIADLNGQIAQATIRGINPNDQLDQRDQLVNNLAKLVGVSVVPQDFGQVTVVAAGVPLVVGNQTTTLQFSIDANNQAVLTAAGSNVSLPATGGQVGGLLQVRNQTLPGYKAQLDTLAGTLAQQVDAVQATGLGLAGPSTLLSSQRAVRSITAPLAGAGLAFPPQKGTLSVTVTDLATGARTLSQVAIDPATQSLQDVANALSAIPNLQAVVSAQTGTLQVLAKPGFAFDFAGRTDQAPNTANITGTTTPQIGGQYAGSGNDVYTYQVVGTGTVGVSPNLGLQVTDSAGNAVATLNIGQGYSPGSSLTVANGITVSLAAGTANNGDSFTSTLVANPDTGGILTALGLNTFFTGSNADDLAVQPALLSDPSLLAASLSGQPGDNSNLTRMIALSNEPLLAGGTQTFSQAYDGLVGEVGTQVQTLTNQQTAQTALGQQLQAQQQSVSGVDPNEELVQLLTFQRAFQYGSKYISVLSDTLNSLLQIL